MQRGVVTITPPTFTGLSSRDRRERAGAANLDFDIFQHGASLFGGEFPGDRPARGAAGEAEAGLQGEVVNFVHYAIDVVGQGGAGRADAGLEASA